MNKTYVVVGGSTGIGSAVVGQLVSAGERVVQLSRHPERVLANPDVTSLPWDVRAGPFPADGMPDILDGLVYCPGTITLKPFNRICGCCVDVSSRYVPFGKIFSSPDSGL